MKRILLSMMAMTLVTSCNTFIGVGRDTRIAGESLEKVAERAASGSGGANSGAAATNPAYIPDDSSVLPVY